MNDEPNMLNLGVAAALGKHYATDQRTFLETLATMLESALPDETVIERRGGLFAKKTVKRIVIALDEFRYTLEDRGRGPLHAVRTRIVRGIALKTEEITMDTWLTELGATLDQRANSSAAAREALARIIGVG